MNRTTVPARQRHPFGNRSTAAPGARPVRIAIVGELREGFPPLPATDAALRHSARALALELETSWLATDVSDRSQEQVSERDRVGARGRRALRRRLSAVDRKGGGGVSRETTNGYDRDPVVRSGENAGMPESAARSRAKWRMRELVDPEANRKIEREARAQELRHARKAFRDARTPSESLAAARRALDAK